MSGFCDIGTSSSPTEDPPENPYTESVHEKEAEICAAKQDKRNSQFNSPKKRRGKRPGVANSLQKGIHKYILEDLDSNFFTEQRLQRDSILSSLPKRYTVYPPLLLLPANFEDASELWNNFISRLNNDQKQVLYSCITSAFSSQGVTHIAVNAPISPTTAEGDENIIRRPTNITPLYGDFGRLPSSDDSEETQQCPSASDLKEAFWASAVQNEQITQVWAPLYSMFSRGNVTEKARILGRGSKFHGLKEAQLGEPLDNISVVDMYAGIGYFVFSYLARGVGRVWAWELNGWSIEGLRRGCEANKWGIKVIRVDSLNALGGLDESLSELNDDIQVVAFHGDNSLAMTAMAVLKLKLEDVNKWKRIRHVNLGSLPTSMGSWESALGFIDHKMGGWIHVHENVNVNDIDTMADSIILELTRLSDERSAASGESTRTMECVHIERVKTYAPGVMHCVFDIHIFPDGSLC